MADTYDRLPPVTVRHCGWSVADSMPWFCMNCRIERAGKARISSNDADQMAPVSGSTKWRARPSP